MDIIETIKRLTITSLMADDLFMGILVLKGGNALDIGYDLSNRGSLDIDFSMEKDFSEDEKQMIRNQAEGILNQGFNQEGLQVFDVRFYDKPEIISDVVKDFWGGYRLEFKVIEQESFEKYKDNMANLRNYAIPIDAKSTKTFPVDISKYEYIQKKRAKDLTGTIIHIYSPEMIALEKLRALCQQNPKYKEIIGSMSNKSRARDFYDIHNLTTNFTFDLNSGENRKMCVAIFDAKKVPMDYLTELPEQYELHRQSWPSVLNTISQKENVQDFDFYFGHVIKLARDLAKSL
ncbi:nucleotidyl transferase AbiEii/AbiGii toxin family protein [Pedobacter sp. R-06]|uniref:nucleotidyl transferase AbiEii/AbiGii toxin family protein n=1 Tax=Pedobacter sp. R-06 TaxID=3404051 RepID=UPI003CFA83BB